MSLQGITDKFGATLLIAAIAGMCWGALIVTKFFLGFSTNLD